MIEKGSTSLDREERKAYYRDALQIQMEQGWNIPTAWRQEVYAYNNKVHGVRVDMGGWLWPHEIWMSE